jgi:hypothetical protein
MNKIFITFGGPTLNFYNSVNRISNQATELDFFTEIIGFTDHDLKSDITFWEKHGDFISNNKRGYGYWLWKPYLITKQFEKINEGDILIYSDCGCEINKNGKQRLLEYIELLENDENKYGIISFDLCYNEYVYTKSELFDYFEKNGFLENNKNIRINTHTAASIIIIKKNKHSEKIINDWYNISCNYDLINDSKHMDQCDEFKDHRHDQSILSILLNIYGSIKIKDETYFCNWDDGYKYPFLAKRLNYI